MLPDRVFDRIEEKHVSKHELILLPSTYRKILWKHGIVRIIKDEWLTYNYK